MFSLEKFVFLFCHRNRMIITWMHTMCPNFNTSVLWMDEKIVSSKTKIKFVFHYYSYRASARRVCECANLWVTQFQCTFMVGIYNYNIQNICSCSLRQKAQETKEKNVNKKSNDARSCMQLHLFVVRFHGKPKMKSR